MDSQALAAVVDGGPPHLVPHVGDVSHILSFDEHREVVLDDKGCSLEWVSQKLERQGTCNITRLLNASS